MADRHLENCERAARVEQWRRAWFDGWTEGVIWTLAKTVHALQDGGHPEAVGLSVIQHVASEHASPEVEAHAEPLTPSGPTLRGDRRPAHEVPPENCVTPLDKRAANFNRKASAAARRNRARDRLRPMCRGVARTRCSVNVG